MGLLIDSIREHGVFFAPAENKEINHELIENMSKDVLRDDLNVFDVTGATTAYLDRAFELSEVPSFYLPFDQCWIEAHDLKAVTTNKRLSDYRWGVLVQQVERTAADFVDARGRKLEMNRECTYAHAGSLYVSWKEYDLRDMPVHGPLCSWAIGLKDDGKLDMIDHETVRIHITILSEPIYDYVRDYWAYKQESPPIDNIELAAKLFLCWQFIIPLYAGIGVLNFRNVSMQRQTHSPKLQHARLRRNKPRFMEYHTLIVNPLNKNIAPYEFGKQSVYKGVMPWHKVRGHVKTYSKEHPRFGRLSDGVGSFWVDGFERGNRIVGEITKDYAVEAGGSDRVIVHTQTEMQPQQTEVERPATTVVKPRPQLRRKQDRRRKSRKRQR